MSIHIQLLDKKAMTQLTLFLSFFLGLSIIPTSFFFGYPIRIPDSMPVAAVLIARFGLGSIGLVPRLLRNEEKAARNSANFINAVFEREREL